MDAGLREGEEGVEGGWPNNEAASDHPEQRPATIEQHSRLKAFIKIIHYSGKKGGDTLAPTPLLPAVISSKGVLKYTSS